MLTNDTQAPVGRRGFWTRVGALWRAHMVASPRYPRFLISLAFLLTFVIVRIITHTIRRYQQSVMPSGGIQIGSLHIHHLVWGILLLLLTGYLALGFDPARWRNRLAICYGIGVALTLDEFALWLNLEDVYWARQGRESIDAGIIAGAVFALATLGRSFWQVLGRSLGME